MKTVKFFVPGVPAPGGSKKSFVSASTGKIVTLDDAKNNKAWRATVASFGRVAHKGDPLKGPLYVTMGFQLERPKGHFGTGRNAGKVKPSAPPEPTVKPDVLKLARSTEDALTGIVWGDDAQNVSLSVRKSYLEHGQSPGVWITVNQF